jgi:hypothetical protein
MTDYETIRLALLQDGLEGVAEHAKAIRQAVESLDGRIDSSRAGIGPEEVPELKQILPMVRNSAATLAETTAIDAARNAFGDLSKHLVDYRRLIDNPESVVAYCSMAQAVWIQPKSELGNPYYGQSMARCGKIVSE